MVWQREKSELMEKCIASWRKYCPDWEIIEWNEDNFDVNFCPYAAKAYREKRYGFLPDAARVKIIYEHGGVYLDTDVELIHSLDELLDYPAWFGYGTHTGVNPGSGFGAEKNNLFIKKLLEHYEAYDDSAKFEVCTKTDTGVFVKELTGFKPDHNVQQEFRDVVVINNIWKYVIHHYTGTWMTPWQRFETKVAGALPTGIRSFLIDIRRKAKNIMK